MSELTDLQPQRFVYAGKRMTTKNTLVHAWLPEGASAERDEVNLYPKAKGWAVGAVYTIEVSEDRHSYRANSVTFIGDRSPDAAILEATDHADQVRHTQYTLEKNMARTSEIKELCAPLRELVTKQVGWANRAALLAYITAEISRS